MDKKQAGALTNIYFERYAYTNTHIDQSPNNDLALAITIPAYNEPNLIKSLDAIRSCQVPDGISAEVIVVINQPESALKSVVKQNEQSYSEFLTWVKKNNTDQLTFHIIYKNSLPKKHAGVGLARKIAMDEAARRLESVGKYDGIIVCFDADSLCEPNYLEAVYTYFSNHPKSPGCSIYFEHPLEGPLSPDIYKAITEYELFLRYYVNALRYAGFPYAYETIGSSMAVRNNAYQKQGGMNKRKAGEDFYFLHRIIPLGNFGEVNSTKVIPSPRQSDRVPFGTGKAVNEWLTKQALETYDPRIFDDLKSFFSIVPSLYKGEITIENLPKSIASFLKSINFNEEIKRVVANSSHESFRKNFFQWFDGFRVLKYVHYARDNYYPNIPIKVAATDIGNKRGIEINDSETAKDLLLKYRYSDRYSD